jgi:hypothetical protein
MPIPNPNKCCFYRIQECTKNEFVGVAPTGNILRWLRVNGDEQRWLILPVDNDKCKIMTKMNGEYMSVGSNGNILRWAETAGKEQLFSFKNGNNGYWNIQEGTKNEYVSVGWDGNILRWAWSGGNDQRFRLVPEQEQLPPTPRVGAYAPNTIPDIPRVTSLAVPPPERSPYYLIGEVILPATYVNDSYYSDRIRQVENNPYYILCRERYWDRSSGRGWYHKHHGGTEDVRENTIRTGITTTEAKSIEEMVGIKFTASSSINFTMDLPGGGKLSATSAISTEITKNLKVVQSVSTTRVEEEIQKVIVKLPASGREIVRVGWSLVDRYTLKRKNGSVVDMWELVEKGTLVEDSFPD